MNLEALKEPFPPADVSWRIGQAGKKASGDAWAKVLAYIDNRNIQERLDSVVGPANWRNEYAKGPEGGVLCGLSIRVDGEWITKWDGAENSDIEPIKGGLSDAMKRAAVQWGIGRYLYDLGESWAEIVSQNTQGAHYANCKVKVSGKEEFVSFYWLPPVNKLAKNAPPPSPPSDRLKQAFAKISEAVRNHNAEGVMQIMHKADEHFEKKAITQDERDAIARECSLALKKINAMENEPQAAA